MAVRPYVFIGSSSEGKQVAEAVQSNIGEVCEPEVWDQGLFQPSLNTLETLVSQIDNFDFAILVLSPDDIIESRDHRTWAPRDNVLVELGMCVARLGRHRTFVTYDSSANIKIPTDFAGAKVLPYVPPSRGSLRAALGSACTAIKEAIKRHGNRNDPQNSRFPPPAAPPSDLAAAEAEIEQRIKDAMLHAEEAPSTPGAVGPDIQQDAIPAAKVAPATPVAVGPDIQQRLKDVIPGAEAPPPSVDLWYRSLWPLLHQSTLYTTPTYYLDNNFNIIDWNISFDLLFADITPKLRHQHVSELIARLINYEEVFDHARSVFGAGREEPTIDIETFLYRSSVYGDVKLLKSATRLDDPSGHARGWAVALFLQEVDWDVLLRDLTQRFLTDKLWQSYADVYDRIMPSYPAYRHLLDDVTRVVPDDASNVLDVGAGSGGVAQVLLKRGFRVTSMENNAELIERVRAKDFDPMRYLLIKASPESLGSLRGLELGSFDGAILVNVLFALQDPFACLIGINRLLKPSGVVGLSTPHAGSNFRRLKDSIMRHVVEQGLSNALGRNLELLFATSDIELNLARRYSADAYTQMVSDAGFEILWRDDSVYAGSVMLIHARKNA